MFFAVLLLVGLGLGAVALWHGGLSELLDRLGESVDSGTSEQAQGTDAAASMSSAETDQQPPEELEPSEPAEEDLSDRELVLGILDENDGRMKQARIVDGTDWSKSKVSMVLSEMEDDGEISKLRVGRENIISVEGSEPEAAGSPFDDE
jgi:uncharacterized membrane protein